MPTPEIGPVGRQLGLNVRRLRKAHEMSLRDLSDKLGQYGRPILASGLLKVERAERRVDVDDLAALAATLEVPAARLLAEEPETLWYLSIWPLDRGNYQALSSGAPVNPLQVVRR
jgi:transcriptional regulator with XRE-family HTH domain